jgi:tetratricopeptide (TPR) repeat protein
MMAGKYLFSGFGGAAPDRARGLGLLQAAAAQGEPDAQYSIAEAFDLMSRPKEAAGARARYEQLKLAEAVQTSLDQALAHRRAGKLDEAIAAYSEALRLDPSNVTAMNDRGFASYMKDDLTGALRDFDGAIQMNPTLADAYARRGRVHAAKGKLAFAVEDFTKAMELDPKLIMVYVDRGMAHALMDKVDLALNDFSHVIERHPWVRSAYLGRAGVYISQKLYGKALADLEALQRLGEDVAPELLLALKAQTGYSSLTTSTDEVEPRFQSLFERMQGTPSGLEEP